MLESLIFISFILKTTIIQLQTTAYIIMVYDYQDLQYSLINI